MFTPIATAGEIAPTVCAGVSPGNQKPAMLTFGLTTLKRPIPVVSDGVSAAPPFANSTAVEAVPELTASGAKQLAFFICTNASKTLCQPGVPANVVLFWSFFVVHVGSTRYTQLREAWMM